MKNRMVILKIMELLEAKANSRHSPFS